jgi:hypothetical protein
MRTFSKICALMGGYGLVAGLTYLFVADYEPAGTFYLLLMVPAAGLMGTYVWRQAVKHTAPEDQENPDIPATTGDVVGVFPQVSAYPLVFAAGVALTALGILVGLWISVLGAVLIAFGLVSLMRESRG